MVHGRGNLLREPPEDALSRALPERHGLDRGRDHVLGPAEGKGQAAVVHRSTRAVGREREGHGIARGQAGEDLGRVGMVQLEPFDEGAAHLFGLQEELGRFAGLQHPVVERADARFVVSAPGGDGLRDQRKVAAREAQVQLVGQPFGGAGLGVDAGPFDRGFDAFGVREAADREGGGGQPDELEEALGLWCVSHVGSRPKGGASVVLVRGACTGQRVLPSANVPRLRLLLYFAAGSTHCPVHEKRSGGAGRSSAARLAHVDGVLPAAK